MGESHRKTAGLECLPDIRRISHNANFHFLISDSPQNDRSTPSLEHGRMLAERGGGVLALAAQS